MADGDASRDHPSRTLGGLSGHASVELEDCGAFLAVELIGEVFLNPPAAQVDAGLAGLGPILPRGGPDSDRTGRPERGGLVASRVGIVRGEPSRAGQPRRSGSGLMVRSMPIRS